MKIFTLNRSAKGGSGSGPARASLNILLGLLFLHLTSSPALGCVDTPIGCIPTNLNRFAGWMLKRGIYLGVLITILLIIISGFAIVSSTGDPERLAAAKSRLTAAIAGLLFLLFSVIILDIIACDIIGGAAKEFFCP